MTLTTHAVAGAAAATLFPQHPVLGFAAGFASHFALDSIPHWDYKLASLQHRESMEEIDMPIGPKFWRDLVKIGFDCALGLALALVLFGRGPASPFLAALGAAAGVLPDALQFAYMKIKKEPLLTLQRFHKRIQTDRHYQERPWFGIPLQVLILLAVIAAHFLLAGLAGGG